MKRNNLNTKSNTYSQVISAQARLLMQQNRQKRHNRIQSMGQRTASELGIEL